jgi:hypothetical protein
MVVSGALERVEQHLKGLRLGNARGIGGGPTYDSGGYRAGQAAGGSVGMTGRRGIGA